MFFYNMYYCMFASSYDIIIEVFYFEILVQSTANQNNISILLIPAEVIPITEDCW
jgi:hypothetical protein